jgi:hypothetical protein
MRKYVRAIVDQHLLPLKAFIKSTLGASKCQTVRQMPDGDDTPCAYGEGTTYIVRSIQLFKTYRDFWSARCQRSILVLFSVRTFVGAIRFQHDCRQSKQLR